jgi:hypothetical protein
MIDCKEPSWPLNPSVVPKFKIHMYSWVNLVCINRPRAICTRRCNCSTELHYIINFSSTIYWENIECTIYMSIYIYKIEPDMHGQIKLNQPREYTREKIMNQGRPGKRANCCSADRGCRSRVRLVLPWRHSSEAEWWWGGPLVAWRATISSTCASWRDSVTIS